MGVINDVRQLIKQYWAMNLTLVATI
jgi:hypothetical protein